MFTIEALALSECALTLSNDIVFPCFLAIIYFVVTTTPPCPNVCFTPTLPYSPLSVSISSAFTSRQDLFAHPKHSYCLAMCRGCFHQLLLSIMVGRRLIKHTCLISFLFCFDKIVSIFSLSLLALLSQMNVEPCQRCAFTIGSFLRERSQ